MQFTKFSAISTRQEIDAANSIIKGVSVISTGEAVGHDLTVDTTTLSQVSSLAAKYTDGLKVRFNHPGKSGASIQSIAGALKNFRVDSEKVRADLHLLKTASDSAHIMELAEKMPESFGLSVVFSGENEEKDGKTFARCTEIYACDLVDDPAANPTGLFSIPTKTNSMFDKIKTMLGFPATATEDEIVTALAKKESEAEAMKQKTAFSSAIAEALKPISDELSALKAKEGQQVALAKKTELEALIVDASKEGKVLPLETGDIFEVKDGVTSIKIEPSMLRKMIQNLPKAQVQLSRKSTVAQGADGKKFEKGSREHSDFYAAKREQGAAELTQKFSQIN